MHRLVGASTILQIKLLNLNLEIYYTLMLLLLVMPSLSFQMISIYRKHRKKIPSTFVQKFPVIQASDPRHLKGPAPANL